MPSVNSMVHEECCRRRAPNVELRGVVERAQVETGSNTLLGAAPEILLHSPRSVLDTVSTTEVRTKDAARGVARTVVEVVLGHADPR